MEVKECPLPGLKRLTLKLHGDARGFFAERFSRERYAALGLPVDYAQDNHSRSAPGILRGLHYQHTPAQGKLVGVIRGRIWDVALDIRPASTTYGQHYALELSDMNGEMLWIPPGFAHGFCVLGDEPADVLYKVTAPYAPVGEGGIRFDDPALAIPWPIANPIISARDTQLPSWAEYRANPAPWA